MTYSEANTETKVTAQTSMHQNEVAFNIQTDTEIVVETWYRVNRDGSPDKRFINNYKIPIVLYGLIHIKTESGINGYIT